MLLMDAGKVLVTDKVIRHIYDMNLQIVWVCDTWSMWRHSYSYLPSQASALPFVQYKIILLDDGDIYVNNQPRDIIKLEWLEVKPTTSWSQVWRPITVSAMSQNGGPNVAALLMGNSNTKPDPNPNINPNANPDSTFPNWRNVVL